MKKKYLIIMLVFSWTNLILATDVFDLSRSIELIDVYRVNDRFVVDEWDIDDHGCDHPTIIDDMKPLTKKRRLKNQYPTNQKKFKSEQVLPSVAIFIENVLGDCQISICTNENKAVHPQASTDISESKSEEKIQSEKDECKGFLSTRMQMGVIPKDIPVCETDYGKLYITSCWQMGGFVTALFLKKGGHFKELEPIPQKFVITNVKLLVSVSHSVIKHRGCVGFSTRWRALAAWLNEKPLLSTIVGEPSLNLEVTIRKDKLVKFKKIYADVKNLIDFDKQKIKD